MGWWGATKRSGEVCRAGAVVWRGRGDLGEDGGAGLPGPRRPFAEAMSWDLRWGVDEGDEAGFGSALDDEEKRSVEHQVHAA